MLEWKGNEKKELQLSLFGSFKWNYRSKSILPNDLVISNDSEFVAVAPWSIINIIFLEIIDDAYKNLARESMQMGEWA